MKEVNKIIPINRESNSLQTINHTVFLLLFFLLSFDLFAQYSQSYNKLSFEKITSVNGLSNNTVYNITQDAEGYIWIATQDGLNKYDGQNIITFYKNDEKGIPGNFVEDLLVTSQGYLIVGTEKGVGIYYKHTDSFSNLLYNSNPLGNVESIIELSSEIVLIATTEGLFSMDLENKVTKVSDLLFRDLCEYKTGVVWAVYQDEILLINSVGEIIKRYSNSVLKNENFDMSSSNIECVFKDSRGIIWLGTKRDGLGYYNAETDKFIFLKLKEGVNPIEDNFVRVINEDLAGRLWIGTESGLYIYDVETQIFNFYGQCFVQAEKGLNDKAIYSIYKCRDGFMWIGTYFGGVNFTSLYPGKFKNINADGGITKLCGNAVSEIIETTDKKIWIATEDGGISILDTKTGSFEYLKHIADNPNSLSSNNVHALEEDEQGNVWIGTFIGGLNKYDIKTKRIERINLSPPDQPIAKDVYYKSLFSIFIDSKKRMWVGSLEGVYVKYPDKENFNMCYPDVFQNNFTYHIGEDHDNNIWFCTYENGIYKLDSNQNITNYKTGDKYDILSDRIVFFFRDSKNILWFGSVEGGLIKYDPEKGIFKSYSTADGLSNKTVYAITEDANSRLWLSTNKGISMFDPTSETFENYTVHDGLIGNQFNFKSGIKTSNGNIYFGAVNGLTYFNPSEQSINHINPGIHFTDFKISNSSVKIQDSDILSSHIDFVDEVRLKHIHKVFTIDFVALNFLSPKNTEYSYYLEGLETKWNYTGNRNNATYTNLSPGEYIFHLKATNSSGIWSDEERTLKLIISPSFWFSRLGFLLYGFIFISVTILFIRFYSLRQREKLNTKLARFEKQKNEELSQHRLNFFTYISHEFKTPLTLIIATLEHLMDYEEILPRFKDYSILMRKNAMRLLFLINQLMDFRKIETDHAALKFSKGDIISFIQSTFESFKPLMLKSSINTNFSSNIESYIVYFDADKLEKILTNLISNSCKSFKKPGTISINIKILEKRPLSSPSANAEKTGDIIINIKDDGIGFSPAKLKQIFEPFHSSDSSNSQSSGIGLSLVNSLVKYLNGNINVTSSPEKGTKTTIQLPLIHNPSPNLIQDNVFIDKNSSFEIENTSLFLDSETTVNFDFKENGSVKKHEILIVEDNKELAAFLKHHFSEVFKVRISNNGEEAIQAIGKSQPDIIISDIMMPRMDGFQLCNSLNESIETCHIPIILLTAKTDQESKIEGLSKGADAYVGKPFNLKELDLQVRNILRSKENLRKHFRLFDSIGKSIASLGNRDQLFIENLINIVIKHLSDSAFNVEVFCQEANVSRTLLHMKLKKLAGLSTTEFINNIRLKEAKKMLQDNKLSISEIAYIVGFNDPAYFSKSFKKMFDIAPSSFIGSQEAKKY